MNVDTYLYNYHDVIFTQIAALQMAYNEVESHIKIAKDALNSILSKLKDDSYGEISVNTVTETLDVNVWDANLVEVLKKECTGYIENEKDIHPYYYRLNGIEIRIAPHDGGYCMSAGYKYKTNMVL